MKTNLHIAIVRKNILLRLLFTFSPLMFFYRQSMVISVKRHKEHYGKFSAWSKSLILPQTSSRLRQTQEVLCKTETIITKIITLSFLFLSLWCIPAARGVLRQRVTRLYKILVQVFKNPGIHLFKQVCPISGITSALLIALEITAIEITKLFMFYDVKSLGQSSLRNYIRNACWLQNRRKKFFSLVFK